MKVPRQAAPAVSDSARVLSIPKLPSRVPDLRRGRGPRRAPGRGPRFLRRDGARGPHRSFAACDRGALHGRAFAGGAGPGVPRLGNASCQRTGQADATRRQGVAQGSPLCRLRRPLRLGRRHRRMLHRAFAAGPALRRRRLASVALQPHPPGVPAQSAMVAQRDHRHSRRSPGSTRTWSSSCRVRSSTWSRRRISCRQIPKCFGSRPPRAA